MKPVIRCSSLDRVLRCNGSATLVPLVAPRTGDEGDEGTACHAATARQLIAECQAVGDSGSDKAKPVPRHAEWIATFCFREVRDNAPAGWSLEVEAALAHDFDRFTLSGHIDCLAINPDATEAIGWDYKTGYDPVDIAEENNQALGYMVLLRMAYPALRKATFHIVQPRNNEDDGHPRVSSVVLEGDVVEQAVASLEGQINTALDHPMDLDSGRIACKWCAAAVQCPALIRERDFMKMTMTEQALAEIKLHPNDRILADWVVAAKTLDRPTSDAKDLAKERIAATGGITATDGTVITQKTTKGAWSVIRPVELWEVLKEMLSEKKRAEVAKWSVSSLKDAFAEEMNIPKSGKAGVNAESVFQARCAVHMQQGERTTFQFQ